MSAAQFIADRRTVAAAVIGGYAAAIATTLSSAASLALAAPLVVVPVFWWAISGPARWIALFFAMAILLPPLPLALGDSGPHPALLAAALGGVAGLARARDWRISLDPVTGAMAAFFCVLLLSVGFAALYSGPAIAGASLARVLLFGISVYVYFYTTHGPARGHSGAVGPLYAAAVIAALFACIDFYFQLPAPAGYGPQFVWLASGVFRRAQGLFYEASTLGNFCAFFLVMIAVCLFRPRDSPIAKPWLLGGGVILSAALIFSFSRASLLNVFVSLCALALVRRVRLKRALAAILIFLVIGGLVVYAVFPSFASSYWIRLSASVEYFWSSPEGVLSGRVASWRTLANFLASHPWHAIFGVGYKTLPYSDFIGRTVIADNMYLSLLVETGVVGLAVFLLFNAAILRRSFRAARGASKISAFFGTWIFCFWTGQIFQMLSGDLMTYWRVLPLYFWALAMAVREE